MTNSLQSFEQEMRSRAQQVIDYALQAGKPYGVTDVKVTFTQNDKKTVTTENVISGNTVSAGIVIYAGQKAIDFSPASTELEVLKSAIDQNLPTLNMVPENPYIGLIEPSFVYKGPLEDLEQIDTVGLTDDEMRAFVETMSQTVLSVKQIKTLRDAGLTSVRGNYVSIATNGADLASSNTYFYAYANAIAEHKKEMQIDYNGDGAFHASDLLSPEEIGLKTAQSAIAKLNAKTPKTSEQTLILSPNAAQTFFGSVFSAISGNVVFEEKTFLKDKIGQRVLNSLVNITDDPTIKRGLGSQVTDKTGMKSEPVVFVENGILKQFNVSAQSARKLKLDYIGRNDGNTTNVIVSGGIETPDSLMADVRDGIYITEFSGGVANVANGGFSRQAEGHRIVRGRVTNKAVSSFVVAGSLIDMFQKAVIANDTPSSTKKRFAVPTTRLDKMRISGK